MFYVERDATGAVAVPQSESGGLVGLFARLVGILLKVFSKRKTQRGAP